MTSQSSLRVLQIVITILGYNIGIIAIKFTAIQRAEIAISPKVARRMKFWRWTFHLSIFLTGIELCTSLQSENKLFVANLWHSAFLLCRISVIGFLFVFQNNADCIVTLFNEMLERAKLTRIENIKQDKNIIFLLLILVGISPPPFFVLGVPLVASVFSDISHSLFAPMPMFSSNYGQIYFKILVFFMEVLFMIPYGCTISLTSCTVIVVVNHICVSLRAIIRRMKLAVKFCQKDWKVKRIGMNYRQIQMFTKVCNEAFGMLILATIHYIGGASLILINFVLFQFHGELNTVVFFGLCFIGCLAMCFIFILFDVGGAVVLYSINFLKQANSQWGRNSWARRFFRSCPVIALQLGIFHKVDRTRALIFCRFIAQRTGVIVVNIRTLALNAHKVES